MPKLAINGGKKTLSKNVIKNWPIITDKEKKAVMKVLDSKILMGESAPQVTALEKEWSAYIGTKYCLTSASGTSALHMAIKSAGIVAGDEIITTSLTFIATAFAALHANAIPVFVDIDPQTYNIDPDKIEQKITEKTKAIIPVHMHGLPADMDKINLIAKKYNLIVIEDACQAHGAEYKGKKVGTLGDMAAFSLNGSKNLPGGEGGLFNTNNYEFYKEAKKLRVFGEILGENTEDENLFERDYNSLGIGYMYRFTEMPAAFTRIRLRSLDKENNIRIKNAGYLTKHLKKFKGIIPPYVPGNMKSVYHIYRIRFAPEELGLDISGKIFRAKVQKALRAEGLQANRCYNRPVPMQNIFQSRTGHGYGCPWTCPYGKGSLVTYDEKDFIQTRRLTDDSIIIYDAIYPPNDIELMEKYIEAFHKLWNNLDEVLEIELKPDEFYLKD